MRCELGSTQCALALAETPSARLAMQRAVHFSTKKYDTKLLAKVRLGLRQSHTCNNATELHACSPQVRVRTQERVSHIVTSQSGVFSLCAS